MHEWPTFMKVACQIWKFQVTSFKFSCSYLKFYHSKNSWAAGLLLFKGTALGRLSVLLYLTFYFSLLSECYGGPQSRGRALVCCWTLSSGDHSVPIQTYKLGTCVLCYLYRYSLCCFSRYLVSVLRSVSKLSQLYSTWSGLVLSLACEVIEPSSSSSPLAHHWAWSRARLAWFGFKSLARV